MSRQQLSNRSTTDLERVVDADQRGRLRHPIPLDHRDADPLPEGLQLLPQRRSPADNRPELPAQPVVKPAKDPPSPPVAVARRSLKRTLERAAPAGLLQFEQQPLVKRPEDARHRRQHRDSLLPDSGKNPTRSQIVEEVDLCPHQRRHEEAHHLAEDVAQWQQRENPQGMDQLLVPAVGVDPLLQGAQVGEQVGVGQADPLRRCRRSRGEDDLGEPVLSPPLLERTAAPGITWMVIDHRLQLVEKDLRKRGGKRPLPFPSNKSQPWPDLCHHLGDKVRGALDVERDDHRPPQQNGMESGHPGWPILAPENHAVPGADPPEAQLLRYLDDPPCQFSPSHPPRANPVGRNNRDLVQTILPP